MSEMRELMEQELDNAVTALKKANEALFAIFGIAEEDEEE